MTDNPGPTFQDPRRTALQTPTQTDRRRAVPADDGRSGERLVADGGTAWTDLTGFQRDLLKSVRRLDQDHTVPTGTTIRTDLESMYGEDINHGRLYQNLNELGERGFIRKVVVDGRTNAYYLTDDAVRLLDEAAREFIDTCNIQCTATNP
ncbi:helix-turn-helix transcriptional regulator [Halobacteriaceae archaeon GCM10025711]